MINFRKVPEKHIKSYLNNLGIFLFGSVILHIFISIPFTNLSLLISVLVADYNWWNNYDNNDITRYGY